MTARNTMAYWFAPDTSIEAMYKAQMDWAGMRERIEAQAERTTIGWTWLQRRGSRKLPLSLIQAKLGDDIEVYRKPSVSTRFDITPAELIGWATPVERKLAQLHLTRKDLGENPLWDVWVRIRVPEQTTMQADRRANKYISDKTLADRVEAERVARVEAESKMSPIQKEATEADRLPPLQQKALLDAVEHEARSELVARRIEYRKRMGTVTEQKERALAAALEIHRERIEKGRAQTAAARVSPKRVRAA